MSASAIVVHLPPRASAALSFLQKVFELIFGSSEELELFEPEQYDERVTINAPHTHDHTSDARHNIILGIIVVLGILLGHALASALFHIPGI